MVAEDSSRQLVHQLTDAVDIYRVLLAFQLARQTLKIYAANSALIYSTIVLHCDQDNNEFVIDQCVGGDDQLIFKHNTKYNLEGILNGILYQFTGSYWLAYEENVTSNGSHRLQFPSLICHQQRRQSFRTIVPRSIHSRVCIKNRDSQHCITGRVLDLSVTGMACEFIEETKNDNHLESLRDQTLDIELVIDKVLDIKCNGQLKDVLPTPKPDQHRFGVAFSPLDSSTERLISKAVVDLQRLTRKNQTR